MSFGIPVRNGLAIGLLSSTTLSSNGGLFPAMALDFLQPFLDTRVTFTRGSNATLVDSTGKIVYAPANLLLQSQTFDNASWTKTATTVTANATTAPDGTTTADKLIETTAASTQHFARTTAATLNISYAFSAYIKAGERTRAVIAMSDLSTGDASIGINLLTGATFASGLAVGSWTNIASAVVALENGWYRVSVTATRGGSGSSTATTIYTDNGSSITYTGDGTSGIFIWGAQLEPVTYQTTPGTYVATTSAAYYGPRFDYDPVTLAPRGLLIEEQRTNLVLQSQDWNTAAWSKPSITVTNNSITAPDGTLTGNKLLTSGATTITQAISSTATSQTFSIYVKLGSSATAANNFIVRNSTTAVNLLGVEINYTTGAIIYTVGSSGASVVAAGNGWWRLTLSVTSGITIGNTLIVYTGFTGGGANGDFLYAWGAQVEAASFATSYIPTVASQVTRSADVATMTGTNFSSWYNQPQGTFVMNFTPDSGLTSGSTRVLSTTSGGVLNRVTDVHFSGGSWNNYNGTVTTAIGAATVTTTPQRIAIAYATANYGYTLNGGTVVADTSALVNSPTQLNLGYLDTGNQLNGHIRSIAYFNTRLTNVQLQQLTAPPLVTTLSLDFINGVYNA